MQIERKVITIRELVEGYKDKGLDGVVTYGGKLDVRPPFQREYIYQDKQRDEVIRSVMKGFPLNVMYWSKAGDHYELMDGQQRTISVCRYVAESEQTFSVDYQYWFNLQEDQRGRIIDYPLDIYVCDGTPSEVLSWFRVINIAGLRLSEQELRNTSYTGPWLADAKIHFSKPTCAAYNMAKDYVKGSPIRQEYLETAISWIAQRDGLATIEDYMAKHQNDENANQVWLYFQKVIQWVEAVFPKKRSEMKGVAWGLLYNAYKDDELDPDRLEAQVSAFMMDDEVSAKKGIYQYVLDGDERHLNLREFSPAQKRQIFERDGGKCQGQWCGGVTIEDVSQGEFDHITPWSKGGKTEVENGLLLCRDCNRRKSNV
jgi:hypothetical protein